MKYLIALREKKNLVLTSAVFILIILSLSAAGFFLFFRTGKVISLIENFAADTASFSSKLRFFQMGPALPALPENQTASPDFSKFSFEGTRLEGITSPILGGTNDISEEGNQEHGEEEVKEEEETPNDPGKSGPTGQVSEIQEEIPMSQPLSQPNVLSSLEEIQEVIDDISEKLDILDKELALLVESQKLVKVSEKQQQEQPSLVVPEQNSSGNNQNEPNVEIGQAIDPTLGQTPQPTPIQAQPEPEQGGTQPSPGGGGGRNYCGKDKNAIASQSPVIFNEISWMGTNNSSNDEWIELKNISSADISLLGWQILDEKDQIKIIFDSQHSILVNGFLILERSDDNVLPAITADTIYQGSLNDSNEFLYFYNQNCQLQDIVKSEPDWPAGNKNERRTMERKSDLSWQTYSGQGENGIMGTPKKENSLPVPTISPIPSPTFIPIPSASPTPSISPLPSPTPSPNADSTAPKVVFFELSPIQNALSFVVSWNIIDEGGSATPSGLDGFIFRWKEENGEWQEDPYESIALGPIAYFGYKRFTGEDAKTYYFQVKAKDLAGNESGWQDVPLSAKINLSKNILINEIQVDGQQGSGGTNEDWVELYNTEDYNVSLAGWSIQENGYSDSCSLDAGFYEKHFPDTAIIPSKGFFLVADTQASEAIKNIADMTIGWSLTENNAVYLVKNQDKIEAGDTDIVDMAGLGQSCFSETAPIQSPPEAGSVQRKIMGLDSDNNSQDFEINTIPSPTNSIGQTLP